MNRWLSRSRYADFKDATEAWFQFGEDGKFQYLANGISTYNGISRKLTNGMVEWHPGLVQIPGNATDYFYFIGDEEIGGNKPATGDVYVTRNATDRDVKIGGVYTFNEDGKLYEYDGITEVNGKLRYYEDAQLMLGNGLTQVDDKYIYVRSNGELVVGKSYWVPANDLDVVPGLYEFDEEGFMVAPEVGVKNGIYAEDDALFYYVDGKVVYGAGLIMFDGSWYKADGTLNFTETAWIYVKSNGTLATGKYYVTNVSNAPEGATLKQYDLGIFDENGILQLTKNGIVQEGENFYFYVDNRIAYNAGVVEYNGGYIYVRSNGMVVKDQSYWVTNVGTSGVIAKLYVFDEDGFFTPDFAVYDKEIVDGYYYVDGQIAYGAGVVAYNGGYIYVRSSGKIATGKYWPTNTNGLIEAKMYDWGEDGILYL